MFTHVLHTRASISRSLSSLSRPHSLVHSLILSLTHPLSLCQLAHLLEPSHLGLLVLATTEGPSPSGQKVEHSEGPIRRGAGQAAARGQVAAGLGEVVRELERAWG